MGKARIAVLVSGGGTNLQALIDAQAAGIITSGTIALVISNNSGAFATLYLLPRILLIVLTFPGDSMIIKLSAII